MLIKKLSLAELFTALSEENAGIDKNGKLAKAGEEVVLVLHGGGILTPERIRQAYSEGLRRRMRLNTLMMSLTTC